jgi:phage shock protein A
VRREGGYELSDFDINNLGNTPLDDTDLSGLDIESAREYVVSFIATLKQTQNKKVQIEEDIRLWESRVKLAEDSQKLELKTEAENRLNSLREDYRLLEAEESELIRKVAILKENLKKLKATYVEYSVDAEQLLADITMIAGEKDELSEKFKQEEAESELERLKKKMDGENT